LQGDNGCGEVESYLALVEVLENSIHQNILHPGWSGISSYVAPGDPAMEDVFNSIVDDMVIIADDEGNFYWPAQNTNTLGDWSVTSGYKIKMQNSAMLNIHGNIWYPLQELSIPAGWSFLPINAICAFDVEELFAAIPEVTMVKDIAQTGVWWPDFNVNTLQIIYPGKAYHILNGTGGPVAFKYPECESPADNLKHESIDIYSPWNTIIKTPSTHIFGFDASVISKFDKGDVIGAFTRHGLCAGVLAIDPQADAQALVAFADDPVSEAAEGFEAGEIVSFKVFRSSTKEEIWLDVIYASQVINEGLFAHNGISMVERVEFKTSAVGRIMNENIDLSIYPNPSSGIIDVVIKAEQYITGELVIYNINGQIVSDFEFEHHSLRSDFDIDLSDMVTGIYYLRLTSDNFTKTEKIILE